MKTLQKPEERSILVDEHHFLFDKAGMMHKKFPSDFRRVRYFGLLVVQKAPLRIQEMNLLEQQVTELLKNAMKHGNKLDANKSVDVWYAFDKNRAQLVVEDEGKGFQDIHEWNAFNRKRCECLRSEDLENLSQYASYHGVSSDVNDGGNALFAALEYWNGGVVFNEKKNAIAVLRKY